MTEAAQINRATRFPLKEPIHYRKSGMLNWHDGSTLNISRTGVLFHTDEDLPTDMKLEIRISLPQETVLACQGTIVRAEPSVTKDTLRGLAARISHCQILGPGKSKELFP